MLQDDDRTKGPGSAGDLVKTINDRFKVSDKNEATLL